MNINAIDLADIQHLEKVEEANNLYRLELAQIRPCIQKILISNFSTFRKPTNRQEELLQNLSLDRNNASFIIAVELTKKDYPTNKIEAILNTWNKQNKPPLSPSDIRSTIKSANKKDKKGILKYSNAYSCKWFLSQAIDFCIGQDTCYYRQEFLANGKQTEPDYISLGWQHLLTAGELLTLIIGIPKIERLRGFRKGSDLYVSIYQLEKITGLDKSGFKRILTKLQGFGLIEYKPGKQHKRYGQATEIKRILPPPAIPKGYKAKVLDKQKGGHNGHN